VIWLALSFLAGAAVAVIATWFWMSGRRWPPWNGQ